MKDAMLKAIKDRRGHGIDLKIIVGGGDDDKNKELAPDAPQIDESPMSKFVEEEKLEGDHDPKNLEALLAQEDKEDPKYTSSPDEDGEMLAHMGGSSPMDHKPRSLAERAKVALMSKMGKK